MTNLLTNPSFGGPHHRAPWPISGELPDGWELESYSHEGDDPIGPTGSIQTVPELIVIQYGIQFPEAHLLYDDSDNWILKCFKQNGAISFIWKQTVSDLPAGRYRFMCPVFPDHWHDVGDNQLVRPSPATSSDWYLASEVFASVGDSETGWQDARRVPIGQYSVLLVECNHPGGALTVRFGARGRWPFKNNGWFFDGLLLVQISEPDPVPPLLPQPGAVDAIVASIEQLAVDYNSLAQAISGINALGQQILVDIANAREMAAKLKSEIVTLE